MKKIILAIAILISGLVSASAQDKPTMTVGGDLVSTYVWRGVYQTGAALQPTLSVGYKGLSIGAWGSTEIATMGAKEFDLSAFYTKGALKLGVTDYWWSGQNHHYFSKESSDGKSGHYLEGTVGVAGPKFSLTWNTMFAGERDLNNKGDQAYSTYIEAGYNFSVGETAMAAAVGVTPWEGGYSGLSESGALKTGAQVTNISLKATKTVKLSDSYSIPVYVQGILAPAADQSYLVFGVTF
ncbi:hypothetical protein [Parabacteroides sp. FAFU027]|uniref:hypothetical protein n=1 Tax=Parabacteroides sp. FAFU027 TaxID=2922715 RepID=UPI001FAE86FC|nr:hypothetical protein [Parabacteroides sp. FAFU027]